jgi:cell wall-associated NlpC family hydrolase
MAATKKNRFLPTFEALEAREVASANPVTRPAALLDHAHVRQLQAGPQVVHDAQVRQGQAIAPAAGAPQAASYPDPLINNHRTYVGLKDLKPGDIILNTTEGFVSETIRFFSNSSYNHAAIYIGNGEVVEAVGHGVQRIKLTDFLKDDHIIRSMVLRNNNLTDSQRGAIADFAIKQVGKPYSVGGVIGQGLNLKPNNAGEFDRKDYYCSQLVAAAYSSAGARLDGTLEHSPGELAGMVNGKLTALGAVYDKGYHRSVREGRDCVNLDVTDREQDYVRNLFASQFKKQFGPGYIFQMHRLTVDSTGQVRGYFTLEYTGYWKGDIITEPGDPCRIVSPTRGRRYIYREQIKQCLNTLRDEICRKYFPRQLTDSPRHNAVDAVFAAAGAGQAGQAGRTPDATGPAWGPVGVRHKAVDAVFAAAGAGQAGQAGRTPDATGPAWGPVDARFDFWLPGTTNHTMAGAL